MEKDTDRKPIVTCHGEQELFSSIKVELLQALQRDQMEWRRSYGRAPKNVFVDVNFVKFTAEDLPNESDRHLLRKPFFHTYWTDCADADAYKLVVKDEISSWQQMLKDHNVQDWLIILVETSNPKRGQKPKLSLPRSSVADKIKSDFCSRQSDRVIVLHEPQNPVPTPRSIDSWQNFLQRLKQLILVSYNRVLGRFEEMVRGERERRNEKGWEFCRYFLLQEELAFTFETLNQYEDALVQYDELDALFSQFIINSQAGENPSWLTGFTGALHCWDGLNLDQSINLKKREEIENGKPTLLDMRNYLFSRQCALLFSLQRPQEVAQRAQAFMHNVVQELSMLEIVMPTGSIACWVFLSCMEVLQICEKKGDPTTLEKYLHYTAGLSLYAQSKLHLLGEISGLMPDTSPTSEQLHLVVGLLGGMSRTQEAAENSPNQKLSEALSSSDAFQKHYLELSELAMGTFKHIGRMRSAKLIGKDLAKFYIKKGELSKAESFLSDAMRIYEKEGWPLPASHTRKQIAQCQKLLPNKHKYLKTCCMLAGDSILSEDDRLFYFKEVVNVAQDLATSSAEDVQAEDDVDELEDEARTSILPLLPMVDVANSSLRPEDGKIGRNDSAEIHLNLHSFLLEPIQFEHISLGLQHYSIESPIPAINPGERHSNRFHSATSAGSELGLRHGRLMPVVKQQVQQLLDLEEEIRYQLDASSNMKMPHASLLACRNAQTVLKREDSTSSLGRLQDVVQKEEMTVMLEECKEVELKPGSNERVFTFKPSDNGIYWAKQLIAKLGGVEFILPLGDCGINLQVLSLEPTLTITPMPGDDGDLLAGIPQEITLSLFTGFYTMKPDDNFIIDTPTDVQILESVQEQYNIKSQGNQATISLTGDCIKPQSTIAIRIPVMAKLIGKDEEEDGSGNGLLEYQGNISCPWNDKVSTTLTFQQPFRVSHRLHTAGSRKCVQISVDSLCGTDFVLSQPTLSQNSKGSLTLTAVHGDEPLMLYSGNGVSYVWIVEVNDDGATDHSVVGLDFAIQYQAVLPGEEPMTYEYTQGFELNNYQTQYTVSSLVNPPSDQELCRAGSLCTLKLFIQSALTNGHSINQSGDGIMTSLMYQIEADASMWAVCGRSKGVVAMPTGDDMREVVLDVMPQIPGNLPVPMVKLCKYLNAEQGNEGAESTEDNNSTPTEQSDDSTPSLSPFEPGQVYYQSMASQVLVLPESDVSVVDVQS